MSLFTLSSIDPLWVITFDGFDLPDDISTVGILGNGTSAFNAVLQSAGTGLPEASITGISFEASEIASLQALRQSEAHVSFYEPLGSHNVVLRTFRVSQNAGGPWPWSMMLVELPAVGS